MSRRFPSELMINSVRAGRRESARPLALTDWKLRTHRFEVDPNLTSRGTSDRGAPPPKKGKKEMVG